MKLKWDTCFKAGVTLFVLYLCIQYWPVVGELVAGLFGAAMPLLIGCVIAYIVNILMSLYEQHFPGKGKPWAEKCRRPVCMLAAMVTLVLVFVLVIGLVLPELASCIQVIFSSIPDALSKAVDFITQFEILPEDIEAALQGIDWQSKVGQVFNAIMNGVGNVMDVVVGTVSSVVDGVVTAFLGLIFAIYLLLGKDSLLRQCNALMDRYLKPGFREKLRYVLGVFHNSFRKYIIGQCTEAVILGILCAIGMALLGLPYATMIGALVAATALIPVAGAYIGGIVGGLMIFSVSPAQALIFIVFLVVLQQLEGNLIYPKVVGSSLGLPAIWVLAAVTVGGGIMGIPGMLLGVPVASALYRILRDDLHRFDPPAEEA